MIRPIRLARALASRPAPPERIGSRREQTGPRGRPVAPFCNSSLGALRAWTALQDCGRTFRALCKLHERSRGRDPGPKPSAARRALNPPTASLNTAVRQPAGRGSERAGRCAAWHSLTEAADTCHLEARMNGQSRKRQAGLTVPQFRQPVRYYAATADGCGLRQREARSTAKALGARESWPWLPLRSTILFSTT
jgi:hypothetical protein